MPEEVVYYVTHYGYLAIFILIFLQETGMPNPFPNELLLIFSGYLSYKGLLNLPMLLITAVSADFIGTNLLYFLFYNAGAYILEKKPGWIPLSSRMIDRLTLKITKGGQLSIYIFRLTPFTRGYTSVITGLLQIKPVVFLPLALISGITWAAFYSILGYYIGPSWEIFVGYIGVFKYVMLTVLISIIFIVLVVYLLRSRKRHGSNNDESHI